MREVGCSRGLAECMSIRPTLQVVAIPSDGSNDLTDSKGKTLLRVSVVGLTWQPGPSKAPVSMQEYELPTNSILGNSGSMRVSIEFEILLYAV
jgi:hypothetical protein